MPVPLCPPQIPNGRA